MSNLATTRLSKPIPYFQLQQRGIFVSVIDLLAELRVEFERDRTNSNQVGMEQTLTIIAYLQLVLDSVPLDNLVPGPDDTLPKC